MSKETPGAATDMALGKKKIIIKKGIPFQPVTSKMATTKLKSSLHPHLHNVLYESKEGDFLNNVKEKVTILNELNVTTNGSRTLALYTNKNTHCIKIKTSDRITQLIGQKNYDILFSAICSIISIELKIRGILSLLTEPIKEEIKTITKVDKEVQTFEMMNIKKAVKRTRQTFCPYVVTDEMKNDIKKVVINPDDLLSKRVKIESVRSLGTNEEIPSVESSKTLIDLRDIIDDSNMSYRSADEISLSGFSLTSDIESESLLGVLDKHTEAYNVNPNATLNFPLYDGSTITLPMKPEDNFHLVTPEILHGLSVEDKKRLIIHQLLFDFKHCLERDEDNNLPLHDAALNNDGDLVRRHCIMLKRKQESVDVPGLANMSALHMAIKRKALQCTSILLQHGACPILEDNESKTALHLAAEINCEASIQAIISHCNKYPRNIMEDNDMWDEKYANTPTQALASKLLYKMSMICDSQGYTPLMLACKKGNYDVVKHLAHISGNSINMSSPSSGDTAVFIAVGAACIDAERCNNMSKVADNYSKTIKTLVENGADPSVCNKSGNSVTTLLTEFNNNELSLLVANTLTSVKYFDGKMPADLSNSDKFILLREGENILPLTMNETKRKTVTDKLRIMMKREQREKLRNECLKLKDVDAESLMLVKDGNTIKQYNSKMHNNKMFVNDKVNSTPAKINIIQNVTFKKLPDNVGLVKKNLRKVSPQTIIRLKSVRAVAETSKNHGYCQLDNSVNVKDSTEID